MQVAAQEGAYLSRLFNRGYDLQAPVPRAPEASTRKPFLSEQLGLSASEGFAKGFSFMNLGILAYVSTYTYTHTAAWER